MRNGLTIEYVPVRNDDALRQLNDGMVDLVACLLETPERARDASFTARIHQMAICGVVRRDSTKIKPGQTYVGQTSGPLSLKARSALKWRALILVCQRIMADCRK